MKHANLADFKMLISRKSILASKGQKGQLDSVLQYSVSTAPTSYCNADEISFSPT